MLLLIDAPMKLLIEDDKKSECFILKAIVYDNCYE